MFDQSEQLLLKTTSITKELTPFFSKLFDFHLYLPDQSGDSSLATPAFLFLPFYIDQDRGWRESFDSLQHLKQFRGYRNPTIEYHTGIRPKEYYQLQIDKNKNNSQKEILEREIELLDSTWVKQKKKLNDLGTFKINIEEFEEDIKRLLEKITNLKNEQKKHKDKILEFNELLVVSTAQLMGLKDGLKARSLDFDFLGKSPVHLECPLCKTEFENSFQERLEIAADIGDLKGYESEVIEEVETLNRKIRDQYEKLKGLEVLQAEIEEILMEKKGQVLLQDYLRHVGRKEFIDELQENISQYKVELDKILLEIKRISKEMKEILDEDRISEIEKMFFIKMKKYLTDLNVKLSEEYFKELTSHKFEKSGSDKPRALLAYFFSILSIVKKYSTSTFCPIIIDSPNQQDQDKENAPLMIKFILENCSDEDQLILGAVDTHGVEFPGKIIEPNIKFSVLNDETFSEAVPMFDRLQEKICE
ncbi:MAG: hypothetical protein COW00_13610 [Bdellovibrio sp. CG12_big_fil_rev_8_21_14_0_65_39_13]|nr:MAG: hypothetical protein COW78_07035 [Bdellovibrio sp. CG22_combo_CG10-13_8_21_14_all_39_27]PIQ58653.1 MAG: hypothetical protein COW00_13610 [Bdellovibrio sp. CG12_big_fil_rev_8_21_14_0_65_39_13]PIR33028.1 MAG: hypothetical protein COV37_18205 [Bdellovibrio sp. CG11_big_fil_rev_8_21_14_0_20_39_38]